MIENRGQIPFKYVITLNCRYHIKEKQFTFMTTYKKGKKKEAHLLPWSHDLLGVSWLNFGQESAEKGSVIT